MVAGCGRRRQHDGTSATDVGDTGHRASNATLINEGTLLVGTDAPYPPFEIGTPEAPDFSGFDIDLINAIAEKLGLEPTVSRTRSFDTIFRDVASGQFDIVAAASTITPGPREDRQLLRSRTTRPSRRCVVPEGSDITSVDDLAGKIVGAQDGHHRRDYAKDETDAGEVRGFPQGRRRARGA